MAIVILVIAKCTALHLVHLLHRLSLFISTLQFSALSMNQPPASLLQEFAPTGKLRIAINLGNAVLAGKDPQTGAPKGVSVDIAMELTRRLKIGATLVPFDNAGKVVNAIATGEIDVGFFAIDPLRAEQIAFTAAYVLIEGAYLVRHASALKQNAEVDVAGNRIVVALGSAYDLHLSRSLKNASLVRVGTSQEVVDHFLKGDFEVAAGVKQQLEKDIKRLETTAAGNSGVRLLPGGFMAIEQAMGVPAARQSAVFWLKRFVEEIKATGFVAHSLNLHRVEGALVAPAAN